MRRNHDEELKSRILREQAQQASLCFCALIRSQFSHPRSTFHFQQQEFLEKQSFAGVQCWKAAQFSQSLLSGDMSVKPCGS